MKLKLYAHARNRCYWQPHSETEDVDIDVKNLSVSILCIVQAILTRNFDHLARKAARCWIGMSLITAGSENDAARWYNYGLQAVHTKFPTGINPFGPKV